MGKKQGRRFCTPTDDDGGNDKEKIISLDAKRRSKEEPAKSPASQLPLMIVKMAKFRCANLSCEGHEQIRDDVPESQAKNFNYCMDCGNESMERVDIYECAKCAKKTIVPYKNQPGACACGYTKLNLK